MEKNSNIEFVVTFFGRAIRHCTNGKLQVLEIAEKNGGHSDAINLCYDLWLIISSADTYKAFIRALSELAHCAMPSAGRGNLAFSMKSPHSHYAI